MIDAAIIADDAMTSNEYEFGGVECIRETAKAILVVLDGREPWVPKVGRLPRFRGL